MLKVIFMDINARKEMNNVDVLSVQNKQNESLQNYLITDAIC